MKRGNNKSKLGLKIKELRLANNMTQNQCAEELDCTPQYLSYVENGKKIPSGNFIIEISKIFKINPGDLFINLPTDKAKLQKKPKSPALLKTLRLLEKMSDEQLESLHQVIKAFIKGLK